jgi:phosphatidyl-myo-inositol alpha-mannosyltransferase
MSQPPGRVLMLCGHFRPTVGGAERQAELVARALLAEGYAVEVLTPRLDPALPAVEDLEGLLVHRFPLPILDGRYPRFLGLGPANLWIMRREVARAVREHLPRFDVLHTHVASALVAFGAEAARRLGRPTICKVACGGTDFDFRRLRTSSFFGGWLAESLVRHLDRWIAISEEVRRDLLAEGVPESRIVSIPNLLAGGAAPEPRAPRAIRKLLCMGRLEKFDLTTLVAGFDAACASHPDLRLRIAGRGDVDAATRLVARFPAAAARTEVVGFVPSALEIARADALVHPSYAEGVANSLLEAMSASVPCVASDIPPNREVLDDGAAGVLFGLGDAAGLARELAALAADADRAARIGAAGAARVRARYAPDRVIPRYAELYGELSRSNTNSLQPCPPPTVLSRANEKPRFR